MTKEELLEIVAKYRRMSDKEMKYGADKCALFDRIADQLEDDIEMYVDDDILELFDEHDNSFGEEELDNHECLIVLNEIAKKALITIGEEAMDPPMVDLMGKILLGINSGESDELIAVKAIAEFMLSGYALDEDSIKEMSKNTREKCQKHLFALQIAIGTIQDYHCSAEEALSQIANLL